MVEIRSATCEGYKKTKDSAGSLSLHRGGAKDNRMMKELLSGLFHHQSACKMSSMADSLSVTGERQRLQVYSNKDLTGGGCGLAWFFQMLK